MGQLEQTRINLLVGPLSISQIRDALNKLDPHIQSDKYRGAVLSVIYQNWIPGLEQQRHRPETMGLRAIIQGLTKHSSDLQLGHLTLAAQLQYVDVFPDLALESFDLYLTDLAKIAKTNRSGKRPRRRDHPLPIPLPDPNYRLSRQAIRILGNRTRNHPDRHPIFQDLIIDLRQLDSLIEQPIFV